MRHAKRILSCIPQYVFFDVLCLSVLMLYEIQTRLAVRHTLCCKVCIFACLTAVDFQFVTTLTGVFAECASNKRLKFDYKQSFTPQFRIRMFTVFLYGP